jgi:hypothetical protein
MLMNHPISLSLLLVVLTLAGPTGCGPLVVQRASPKPNVAVELDRAPSSLAFGDEVQSSFTVPETGAVREIKVTDWRATLQEGFDAAFSGGGREDRQLRLERTELSFTPLAMDSGGTTRAVAAQIRFLAQMTDAPGATIFQVADTVRARDAITSPGAAETTRSAGQAVEAMYERIAAALRTNARKDGSSVAPAMGPAHP